MRNPSSADQVPYFNQAIKDVFDNSEVLTAVFVDFKSAYDCLEKITDAKIFFFWC